MPTMALCKRWQFISPPIEVGEFLLILVKYCFYQLCLIFLSYIYIPHLLLYHYLHLQVNQLNLLVKVFVNHTQRFVYKEL